MRLQQASFLQRESSDETILQDFFLSKYISASASNLLG
ncbi:hypothetical protein NEOC65_000546 [Neochlamydia sp. AcF65]|nr:hypothetical protein [Neochlamydia sp. AcF65]